jgi:predicted YcjX-like family ATPase
MGNVSKIAFVASKADRVHEKDRSKLDALLHDMSKVLVDPFERNKHMDVKYFVCSAVESSKSHEYPRIEGRFVDASGNFSRTVGTAATTPVPARWPDTWKPGDFQYPENAPNTPDNEQAAPYHIGLDRLLSYILDL